jgi:membrane-associated phospholipid phosphatase
MGKKAWAYIVLLGFMSFLADRFVNSAAVSLQTQYLTGVMAWFSNLLTVFVVLVVMSSLFMLQEKKTRWLRAAWLSAIVALLLAAVFKEVFMRLRPVESAIGAGLLFYAFPSAHAAVAFSLVPILGREFKYLKLFWITFAILICISRIYLGAHYLSDVIWGGILGYAIGMGFLWMEKKDLLSWKRTMHLK